MSVEIKNIGEFHGQLSSWINAVKLATAEAAMGLAHDAFEQILETGPQNSGDFVANTKVAVGRVDESFTPSAVGVVRSGMFKMGDTEAMGYARDRANWTPGKLGETVFISSSAAHDDPYAVKIEEGLINLRDVNEGADFIYRRAAMHTGHTYKHIGKVQMETLRKASR